MYHYLAFEINMIQVEKNTKTHISNFQSIFKTANVHLLMK